MEGPAQAPDSHDRAVRDPRPVDGARRGTRESGSHPERGRPEVLGLQAPRSSDHVRDRAGRVVVFGAREPLRADEDRAGGILGERPLGRHPACAPAASAAAGRSLARGDRVRTPSDPSLRWRREAVSGARLANAAPSRSATGATSTSARSCSMAPSTAAATWSGVRVPMPGGSFAPESWNIPAPRMNPGETTDTPTPDGRRSSRRPSAKPRSPNFVAE